MKKKISIVLCIAMILCLLPTSIAFAAKKVKSKSVSLAPKAMTLAVGDVAQLNATMKPSNSTDKLTWTSSDKSIATVSSKGLVQAKAKGEATITVKTSSNKKATCIVTVKEYISDDEAVEAIREKLKEEFATKEDVLSLIKQNTYTKSEIDSKISSAPSGSGSTVTNQCDCANELTTSGNVPLHSGQKTTFSNNGKTFTVTNVNVTKSLFNDFSNRGTFYVYKYDIHISGTTDANMIFGEVYLTNKYGARDWFNMQTSGIEKNTEINDGKFETNLTFYGDVNATEMIIKILSESD